MGRVWEKVSGFFIWYQKGNPNEVLMEGKDEWLLPTVLGAFGVIFSLIGLPGLLKELFL